MHDPREAGHPTRGVPRQRRRPEARAARPGDRRRRLLRGGAARADLRAVPVRRRRVRARIDPAPRRVDRGRRVRGRARTVRDARALRGRSSDAPRATLPGVGAGLDGLQLGVRVLHRPGRPRPRAEPPTGRDRRRGHAPRGRRASARSRCSARTSTRGGATSHRDVDTEFGELLRACDAVAGIERIRFTSPHPKDFRAPVIAAMAECASVCEHVHLPRAVGLVADPQGACAGRTTATRYLAARRRRSARRSRTSRSEPISSSASRARPTPTSRRRSRSSRRCGSTARSRSSTRRARGRRRPAMPDQVPDDVKHERLEVLVEVVQRVAAERNAQRVGARRGGARRGAEPHRRRAAPRPHTSQHDGQLRRARRSPGDLVDVLIEGATSTTLRGDARRRSSRPEALALARSRHSP